MSLGKIYRFYDKEFGKKIAEEHYKISDLVIPFSRLFKSYKPSDIYSGTEKIAFKERDSEYKMILMQEF
ncbi:MAG: hypothetical protein R3255_11350 [Candidatus Lokiarchaeia archaeon]|nr:hypothetical protein [Candidatus Lokiarchaeia archaeon]